MSGECDKCHEHPLDCRCNECLKSFDIFTGTRIEKFPDCIYCKRTCKGTVYLSQVDEAGYKFINFGESIHFSCYITMSVEKEIKEQLEKILKKHE